MNKIISLNNGVSNAFVEAMSAIEAGRYSKVINLLNYVKNEAGQYDQVMVEYALLISYVNTGELESAQKCLDNLDALYIENDQIKQIIAQIKRDVMKTNRVDVKKGKSMSFEQALEELRLNEDQINILYEKHPDDPYFQMLKEAIDNEGDARNEVVKELVLAKLDMIDFVKKLSTFVEFTEELKPIYLFESLNQYESDTLRWLLVTPETIDKIYQNRRLPSFIRKYILERAVHFVHYGIFEDFQMRVDGELIYLSKLPDFNVKFFEVVNDINAYYNVDDNIYDMISSVLNIVYVNNYPENVFSNLDKLHATVGYIVNDIFVGRRFDSVVEKQTGFKFDDVKVEIKNMELLITFLIS